MIIDKDKQVQMSSWTICLEILNLLSFVNKLKRFGNYCLKKMYVIIYNNDIAGS